MKITISSGAPDQARDVLVEDESGELASFKADNLHEAHKMLAHGRNEGWGSLKAPRASPAPIDAPKDAPKPKAAKPKKAK